MRVPGGAKQKVSELAEEEGVHCVAVMEGLSVEGPFC